MKIKINNQLNFKHQKPSKSNRETARDWSKNSYLYATKNQELNGRSARSFERDR